METPKQDQKVSVQSNQIAIYWDILNVGGVASGNSPITEYVLQEDNGDGNGFSRVQDSMSTDFLKRSAVPKKEYKYKVSARNVYGLGPHSDITILSTGQRPNAPATITSVNPVLGNGPALDYKQVVIGWNKPDNNGSPITEYKIRILKKNNSTGGTYVEDKSMCDGSLKDPTGKLIQECTLQSVDLQNNFNYKVADRLIAVVVACNKVGCSSESKPNRSTMGQVDELKPFTLIGGRKSRN